MIALVQHGHGSWRLLKHSSSLLMDEGNLVLPVKNSTAVSGTQIELLPFLERRVTADGFFTTNHGYRIFALQFVREAPNGEWRGASEFLKA